MAKHTICLIEGDGVGREVIPAARRVLEALGVDAEFVSAEAGWEVFERRGASVPGETLDAARAADAVLFGATTSPSRRVEGFFSAIRYLRRELDLFANLRPARSRAVPGCVPGVDLVIVRENTEGLYVAQERRYGDTAIADAVITRSASARVGRLAAELAARRRGDLAVVHKANVLPVTQGLFLSTVLEEAARVPGLRVRDVIVDACAMHLVRDAAHFDVLVMTNLFGDILSDLTAGLTGGLGVAPSGNVGERHALFESVHGSAPDIAGQGVANPTATVLSAAMMLDHLGEGALARRLEAAVDATLQEGPRTRDLGGEASTDTFTQALIRRVS
ncbi:isocitrate/isopropylmalate dehydrogenase family protein [Deinococcus pimensis]|uniref:isocitrate/isopropylmalate dehydrogenase family protein n=1 Tax=Deinococcus pimensis TaxID=309888 RepID=UPI000484CC9C|nr:isocitrate/isopropylmalate dehydrogenase family protein [Deinococcus pimensis]